MSTASQRTREKPSRPAITPLFWCGCLLWAACAAAYAAGRGIESGACQAAACAFMLGSVVPIALFAVARRPVLCFLAALLLGASMGLGHAAGIQEMSASIAGGGAVRTELVLEADSKATSNGEAAFAMMESEYGHPMVVYADFGDREPILAGTRVLVTCTMSKPDWSRDEYLWQNGAAARVRVKTAEIQEDASPLAALRAAREQAIGAIGSRDEEHALVQAIVCGYRHDIVGTAMYARFQMCGVAHLVAVSGAHLVIVTGMLASVLRAARVPRRLSTGLLIAVMLAYLVLSGAPVSAIRAAIMSGIALTSAFGRRRPSAQNALGVGMVLIVSANPASSLSVSFALSALSTAGIVLFSPLVSHWLDSVPIVRAPVISDALSLTFGAGTLSQLYASSVFNVLPLASPLANIACAPLFPLTCSCGLASAIASCLHVPGATLLQGVASMLAGLFGSLVDLIAGLPLSCVPLSIDAVVALVASICSAGFIWLAWPTIRPRALLAAAVSLAVALAGVSWFVAQEDAIIMLDVGQGDSFLVRSRGETLLVDTGNRDSQLIEQLARCAVLGLDSVLLTHADDDHVGSLDALERAVPVKRAIMADGIQEAPQEKCRQLVRQAERTAERVSYVRAGDTFEVGAFTARVAWPGRAVDGGNADSICLLLEYDGDGDGAIDFTALFTGDAEQGQVSQIVDAGAVGDVDVLKVGHHGSRNGLDERLARTLDPEIALIGVGARNRYGHPAPETLSLLDEVGCRVFRSDVDGQVKCSFAPDAIRVELQ